jgi:hypothetical protein
MDDDMAAVMGFSSFTEMPKSKRQKVYYENISTSSSNNPNKAPLGQRRQNPPEASFQAATDSEEQPRYASNSPEPKSLPLGQPSGRPTSGQAREESSLGYGQTRQVRPGEAHPSLSKPLEELTQQDLQLLRRGIRDGEGRTVYFSRRFIEDPWSPLKSSSRSNAFS